MKRDSKKPFIFVNLNIYLRRKNSDERNTFFLAIGFAITNIKAQDKVNWLSFEEAIELNKKTPKPLLIDVYTDWCGWCKKMDKDTYSNKTIIKIINNNFYAVKLNGEEKKDIIYKNYTFKFQKNGRKGYHQLAASLLNGKLSYPATVFMNKEGEVIQNVSGYLKKERLEIILAYFTNENHKTKKWKNFEKNFKSKI